MLASSGHTTAPGTIVATRGCHGLPNVALNIFSTYLIVFVNKAVFREGFTLVCTLTALHLLSTAFFSWLRLKQDEPKKSGGVLPMECMIYAVFFGVSVIGFNFSLLFNEVSTYQLLKLLILPVVALLESFLFTKKFTSSVIVGLCMLTTGGLLPIFENSDFAYSGVGLFAGTVGVVATGAQTVYMKVLQNRYQGSEDMLGILSAWSFAFIFLVSPLIDTYSQPNRFNGYAESVSGLFSMESFKLRLLILGSCLAAVLVNLSQYLIIGRFSPLTFQVVGQVKNIGIIILAGVLLGEKIGVLKAVGCLLGTAGTLLYSGALEDIINPAQPFSTAVRILLKAHTSILWVVIGLFLTYAFTEMPFSDRMATFSPISLDHAAAFSIAEFPLPAEYNDKLLRAVTALRDELPTVRQQYFADWNVHAALKRSPSYSTNLTTADFVYVPFYSGFYNFLCKYPYNTTAIRNAFVRAKSNCPDLKKMNIMIIRSEAWESHQGEVRFIMTSNHPYYDNIIPTAVFFTVEDMRLSKMYQMLKEGENLDLDISVKANDVIIPYSVVEPPELMLGSVWFDPERNRPHHMIFQGTDHSPKRKSMFNATKHQPNKYHFNHPDVPTVHAKYMYALLEHDFCFAPEGQVRTTVRIFEALIAGCIPVIWNDHVELPYTMSIDYSKFSVSFGAGSTAQEIIDKVSAISSTNIVRMRRELAAIRPSEYFSHVNPMLNSTPQRKEMGDKIWEEFGKHVINKRFASSVGLKPLK